MSSWEDWADAFLHTFADRGWTEVCNAFSFKYLTGSYADYAIRKLKLIVDADPELTEKSRVLQIVIGLPAHIREKINRKRVDTFCKLVTELNQFESVKPFVSDSSSKPRPETSRTFVTSRYKPCSICEGLGRPNMYHPERLCYNNKSKNNTNANKNNEKPGEKKSIRIANNTEMEEQLNNEVLNQKN